MRSHLLATFVLATPLAFAAELNLPLTPDTLPYWSLSGAKPGDLSTEPLTLPPGAQVSRIFTTDHAAVQIETSPTFALDAEDWAVLELGSAALVFAREAGTGYLALAVGATEVILHPHTIPLNDEGRASEPVSATLLWQGRRVSLDLVQCTVNGVTKWTQSDFMPAWADQSKSWMSVATSAGSWNE
jgi:hypothetical protein